MTIKKKVFKLKDLNKKLGAMTVGGFLRSWRLSEELSQKEFARMLNISAANLCDLEKGRKCVSPERAYEIAKCIGYSPSILMKLAIEEQLIKAGLHYTVEIKDAA